MRPPQAIVHRVERSLPGALARIDRAIERLPPGSVVTSRWRSEQKNRDVNGEPDSQHLLGLAIDVVGPDLAAIAASLEASGLLAIPAPRHVHGQVLSAGIARQLGFFDGATVARTRGTDAPEDARPGSSSPSPPSRTGTLPSTRTAPPLRGRC